MRTRITNLMAAVTALGALAVGGATRGILSAMTVPTLMSH